MPSIGIAGAGILGRVLAWRLVQAGFEVSLFDSDSKRGTQGACWTAAGMLTPHTELEASKEVFELELRALGRWSGLVDSLNADGVKPLPNPPLIKGGRKMGDEAVEIDNSCSSPDKGRLGGVSSTVSLQKGGCLVLAHPQDTASLNQFNQVLQNHAARPSAQAEYLDYAALKILQPELAERFRKAIWFPHEQWVNPHKVMHILETKLIEAGVIWHEYTPVTQLSTRTIHTAQGTHTFDCVIDTRGLGAKADWQGLRGVRGELIELHAPEVNFNCLVRLLHPRYALYVVPRSDHHYVIGATQIESEDTSPISVRSALELLSAAYSIHSGFAEARMVATRTNCRPTLPDHAPHTHTETGLIRTNGLYRHGILLSPEIAYQIEQQLEYALC